MRTADPLTETARALRHGPTGVAPPVLRPRPVVTTRHGRRRADPFEWLRDDPAATATALAAEDAHTRALLAPLDGLVDDLLADAEQRVLAAEVQLAVRDGDWFYALDVTGGPLPRVLRRPADDPEPPPEAAALATDPRAEVVLDLADEFAHRPPARVGSLQLSRTGSAVVWTEDPVGDERYVVRARPCGSSDPSWTVAEGVSARVQLSPVADELLAVHLDERHRPSRVHRHSLDADATGPGVEVFVEADRTRRVRLSRSSPTGAVVVVSATRTDEHVRAWSWHDPVVRDLGALPTGATASVVPVPAPGGSAAFLAHVVDDDRPGGALLGVRAADTERFPGPHAWPSVLAEDEDRRITGLVAPGPVLVGVVEAGRQAALVADGDSWPPTFARLGPGAEDGVSDLADVTVVPHPAGPRAVVVARTGWTHPPAVHLVDLDRPDDAPRPLTGGVEASPYVEERLSVRAEDGVEVPMTVVHRPDRRCGPGGAVLHGYGAYGQVVSPRFDPVLLPLLDRGLVLAVAHVRGGGELGRDWHRAAVGTRKDRSMEDFLRCRDHLVEHGWAAPDRVAAMGASAGGLLVGSCLTRAPGAFAAAALDVPFVDPLSALLDPDQPLTASDHGEFGDPLRDPAVYAAIAGYAPYDTLPGAVLPPVLASCATRDSRVPAVEVLKWVQRARADAAGGPVALAVDDGGHLGAADLTSTMRAHARSLAWLAAWVLGPEDPERATGIEPA